MEHIVNEEAAVHKLTMLRCHLVNRKYTAVLYSMYCFGQLEKNRIAFTFTNTWIKVKPR